MFYHITIINCHYSIGENNLHMETPKKGKGKGITLLK